MFFLLTFVRKVEREREMENRFEYRRYRHIRKGVLGSLYIGHMHQLQKVATGKNVTGTLSSQKEKLKS